MADEGPTTVGSINGYLHLDADQFMRESQRAEETADRLDGRDVTVHAHADTAAARANLAALDEQQRRLTSSTDRSMATWEKWAIGITAGIGPAASLSAGLAGLAVAFGVMAGAGVAAIVGIKHEMEQGTTTGQVYAAGLSSLKVGLDQIEQTGAQHFLDGFATSVSTINRYMPFLNGLVANGADALGNMASNLTGGLLQGLEKMQPLIQGGTTALSQFVGWLSGMSSTNGFTEFVAYATANLPAALQLIESLVTLAGRVVAAFAPLGPPLVALIQGLVDVLNSFPLPMLAGLATTVALAGTALRIMGSSAIASGIQGVAAAIGLTGVAANLAVPVVGILTAALAGLVVGFATSAASQQAAIPVAQEYASALERDGNAIGEYTTKLAVKKLAEAGAYDAVSKLGLGTDVLTKAVTGNADAQKILRDRIAEVEDRYKTAATNNRMAGTQMSQALKDQNVAATALQPVLESNIKAISDQQHYNELAAAAIRDSSQAAQEKAAADEAGARTLGVTTAAYTAAAAAQAQTEQKTRDATLAMQMQNDAAGILKATLDGLNGKALSAAQAQNAFDSQLANMGTHVDKVGKQITFTTANIGDMSAASVALRGQLNGQVAALQSVVEANGGLDNSTGKAREQMETMRQQIIDNAVAHGVDRDAVTQYIDKILQIPKEVPPTKIDADTAAAASKIATLQMQLDALHDKVINVAVRQSTTGDGTDPSVGTAAGGTRLAFAQGGSVGYLAGGGVHPDARGTDTVPAMLTPREFVIRQGSADSLRRSTPGALEYINRHGQLPPQQQAPSGGTFEGNLYLDSGEFLGKVRGIATQVAQSTVDDSWADASRRRIGA